MNDRTIVQLVVVAAMIAFTAVVAIAVVRDTRAMNTGLPGGQRSPQMQHPISLASAPLHGCPRQADACVDIRLRISWLQHDGQLSYGPVPIMPGRAGLPGSTDTPQGLFRVQWKNADQVSDEFHTAMPHAVFFAPGGIAFHEGSLFESSHGCVHLEHAAAKYYYDHLPVGAQVAVFR